MTVVYSFACSATSYHKLSQDCSLLFNQEDVTTFQKQMALAIFNFGNDTVVSIVNEDSEVHADSIGIAPSRLNGNQEIATVRRDVPQGSPFHNIISSTNNSVYITKMQDKLPQNIMNYLQECINKCFKRNVTGGAGRQFKYYQTSSDENDELDLNVFLLAKGLLKRLNHGKDQMNKFAPYETKCINLKGKKCDLKAPTQYTTNQLVAYIVVPLRDKNDESITMNLQL
jgi:hypothetical protein